MEEQKDFQQPNAKKSRRAKALAIAISAVVAVGAIVAALVILLGGNNEQPPHTCAFGDWTTTKAATCVTEGEKTRVCECGEKETEAIAKKAHSYGDWVTTKEATCTSLGEKTRECECGAKELSDVEMLAHHFSDWNIVKNVSCSEAGIKERSCACGEKETEAIEKIPHTFASWITEKEPTCKEIGISSRMCSVCEYKETNAIAKTNNHTEVIDAAVPSTCVKTGLTEGKHCSVCNVVTVKQTEVPKANHAYDDKYDEYCNVCDFKRDVECTHSESVVIPGREATCLESGLTEGKRCKNCEEIIVAQTEIDPKGHTEEKIVGSAPTCTATGLSDGVKCSVCDKTLVEQSVLPKSDHEYVDSIIAPTCIEQGYTLHKCSSCDFNYKDNYVNRIDHNWGEWKINGTDTVRDCTNECNCGKAQKILSFNATYNGIRLLIGESVSKEDVAVTATLSDNTTIDIIDFTLENVFMTVDGANYVTVKFMTVSTTVLVPAIYNNLPGTTATSEFTYTTQNDEVTITGFIGSSENIVIPAHINRVPVRYIGDSAFASNQIITSATVAPSVKTIGKYAFQNVKYMTDITFHEGLESISGGAFMGCPIKTVNIPDSVTTIETQYYYNSWGNLTNADGAFENCEKLTSVTLGNKLLAIGRETFQNCTSLATVVIGDGVETIGAYVFAGCSSLTDVMIGKGVHTIYEYAFENCTELTNISIPSSVELIDVYCFKGCTRLETVTFNEGLKTISGGAFMGCPITELVIPDSVIKIGARYYGTGASYATPNYDGAFENCTKLKTVTIGNRLEIIENDVFRNCTYLTTVVIGERVETIGEFAFANCTSLAFINISNVSNISNNAFDGCPLLTN